MQEILGISRAVYPALLRSAIRNLVRICPNANQNTWAEDMLASYMELNPEQAQWFNTTEVETLAERDALTPSMGDWCYVADVGGTSKEYIYDSNIETWYNNVYLDSLSTRMGGSTGQSCKAELLSRLTVGGYLEQTYGTSGLNRETCNFVYLLFMSTSNSAVRAINQTLRWDLDGNVVTQENFPVFNIGSGKGIMTFSADSFTMTKFQIDRSYLAGACPSFNFPNLSLFFYIHTNRFSGKLPSITLKSNAQQFAIYSNYFIGNLPELPYFQLGALNTFDLKANQFTSVEGFLAYIYTNRALYTRVGTNYPGVNITAMAQPAPYNKTPAQAYADGDTGTGKWFIHVLTTDPLGEGFRPWTINYNQSSEGMPDNSMVAVSLDDGHISNFTVGKSYFSGKSISPTMYLTTGYANTENYVTDAQVLDLISNGWYVGDHSNSHPDLTTLSEAQVTDELDASDAYFSGLSLATDRHFACPFNRLNDTAKNIINLRRPSIRNDGQSPFYLNVDLFDIGTKGSDLRGREALDELIEYLKILIHPRYSPCFIILYGHKIEEGTAEDDPGSLTTTTGAWDEIIAAVLANGAEFKRVDEIYDLITV